MAQTAAAVSADPASKRRAALSRLGALIATLLALLVVINIATHGNFLAPGNVLNILRQIAVNAILATGQTFVIITAGIDLSVGSLIALTGVLMAGSLGVTHLGALSFLIAAAVGIGIGGAA